MSLAASLKLSIAAVLTGALDLSTQNAPLNTVFSQVFSDGAGADQASKIFADSRTLAASGTEDIDLSGALTDLLNNAAVFTKIKAIIIKARAENVNNVVITRPAANGAPLFIAAGDGISLAPGEVFAWFGGTAAGKAITAATGDLLTVTNSAAGTAVTYDIIVIGA